MWVALLVVAPVVLATALAVRRDVEPSQSLPASLGGVGSNDAAAFQQGAWRWTRSLDGRRLALEVEARRLAGAAESPDTLLYWSLRSNPDIDAWLWDDSRSPLYLRSARSGSITLPPDAVLLGPWEPGSVQRLEVPDGLATRQGVLVWYSAGHACVTDAMQASELPEPPP